MPPGEEGKVCPPHCGMECPPPAAPRPLFPLIVLDIYVKKKYKKRRPREEGEARVRR